MLSIDILNRMHNFMMNSILRLALCCIQSYDVLILVLSFMVYSILCLTVMYSAWCLALWCTQFYALWCIQYYALWCIQYYACLSDVL